MAQRRSKRPLIYVSMAGIPSRSANSIQTVKMASAFADVYRDFRLMAAGFMWVRKCDRASLADWYGVRGVPRIIRVPDRLVGSYPFSPGRDTRIFLCLCFLYFFFKRNCVIYTREEKLLKWSKWLKIPMLFEVHLKPTFTPQELNKYVRDNSFLRGVVSISPFLANVYSTYLPSSKVLHCEDGVRQEDYDGLPGKRELRARLGIKMRGFRHLAVFTGHLYPDRGIETIFGAARMCSDTLFLIVGGWDSDIENRKKEIEGSAYQNLEFRGFRPHNEMPLYQKAADVLLLPYSSRLNIAKFFSSLKLFEYMASGTPIVASHIPRVAEVLTTEGGFLFPPDDCEALAKEIEFVYSNADLALQRGQHARMLSSKYSWTARAKTIVETLL